MKELHRTLWRSRSDGTQTAELPSNDRFSTPYGDSDRIKEVRNIGSTSFFPKVSLRYFRIAGNPFWIRSLPFSLK